MSGLAIRWEVTWYCDCITACGISKYGKMDCKRETLRSFVPWPALDVAGCSTDVTLGLWSPRGKPADYRPQWSSEPCQLSPLFMCFPRRQVKGRLTKLKTHLLANSYSEHVLTMSMPNVCIYFLYEQVLMLQKWACAICEYGCMIVGDSVYFYFCKVFWTNRWKRAIYKCSLLLLFPRLQFKKSFLWCILSLSGN